MASEEVSSILEVVKNEQTTSSVPKPNATSKRVAIDQACNEENIALLRIFANEPGGFLEDGLRRRAWPLLLGCHDSMLEEDNLKSWREMTAHQDEEQVQKDVDRSFIYYPNNESQSSINSRKAELFGLIVKVLRVNRMLNYFQGYHDIVQVFLLVLGEKLAFPAVSRVSLLRIRDYMLPTFQPAEKHLQLIPQILKMADSKLARHLAQTPPFFALSATITLYAHEIQEYNDIARLYDFILAHEPVLTIYLFSSLIVLRRLELLQIPADDHDMLLFTLSKLPQPLDLEAVISKSLYLYTKFPPEKLPGWTWSSISSYSVLKTSRMDICRQSLETGRELFNLQSKQLRREELASRAYMYVSRRRKPLISIGATVFIGLCSFWLRKSGNDRILWAYIWRIAEYGGKK